jgi:MtN3 and saliva related transmembrane protein
MLSILATGIAMWTVYGVLKSDIVIIIANAVSLALLIGILYFKLREP